MDASAAQSDNTLETFSTNQFMIYSSAPTLYNFHISRILRSGTCKEEVNVFRLCPNMVQITVLFLSLSLVTPRHRCVIMNVPQHYYLLDTLVKIWFIFINLFSGASISQEVKSGVDHHLSMPWYTSEVMLMIMTAGRRKAPKAGHMLTACHTSGSRRPMN